jgi:hypothetical protein
MAKTTAPDTVVLLDDEFYNMTWMWDYLYSKDLNILAASTANEAIDILNQEIYRLAVIDLNVPILPPLDAAALELGAVYVKYPGLFVARHARNKGYRGRQVVIYSVHRDVEVSEIASKLGCTYILKGRPQEIKEELEGVMSFDPTEEA